MAWQSSRLTEFRNTRGQIFTCNPSTEAWRRVHEPHPNREVFEKIEPPSANIQQDHVILAQTAHAVSDADVPLLVSAASDWEYFAAEVPGFTREMLNVADLLCKAEPALVDRFNSIAVDLGLQRVDHISHAIDRAKSAFISVAERDALELAMDQFFGEVAGDRAQLCRQQWSMCIVWMRKRLSVAHPLALGNAASLAERLQRLHAEILQEPAYAAVREAATVLTEQFAEARNISL